MKAADAWVVVDSLLGCFFVSLRITTAAADNSLVFGMNY